MLVEAEAAQAVIDQVRTQPQGVVRMSCPTALLNFQFGELIARFMVEYPRIEVHLESTNGRVDVIGEGFDLAIRVRFPPLEQTDLVMRKLDESTQFLVASPALLHERAITQPVELGGFPSLDLGPPHGEHSWCLEGRDGETALVPHQPKLVTDDMSVLRRAALAGVGIVQMPSLMVWDELQAGRLVSVLPDWRLRAGIVHAVFPSRRGLLPSVRTLVDFLADQCAVQRRASREVGPS